MHGIGCRLGTARRGQSRQAQLDAHAGLIRGLLGGCSQNLTLHGGHMARDQDFVDAAQDDAEPQASPRIPRVHDWRPPDDQDDDLDAARGILRAMIWCLALWTVAAMALLLMLP